MNALMIISLLFTHIGGFDASVIESISAALKSGQVEKINQYYSSTVDVTILQDQGFYPKNVATQKVLSFFKGRQVKDYSIVHEGKSKGKDSVYTIGNLTTNDGDYRVYMFITTKGDKHFIEEIKIERKE
ncbi:MAG: DUF4783 domain-containing protein [Bacteroidia bacterium]|nr:DUF4783 domain-containing protein [Bacteroidia bacterium]